MNKSQAVKCLPDRNVIFWNEIRRNRHGLHGYPSSLLLGLLILSWIVGIIYFIQISGSGEYEWRSRFAFPWLKDMFLNWFGGYLVLLLAPGMAAMEISGEQERRSLDQILISSIKTQSIILGMWMIACLPSCYILLLIFPYYFSEIIQISIFKPDNNFPPAILLIFITLVAKTAMYSAIGLLVSSYMKHTRAAVIAALTVVVLFEFIAIPLFSCILDLIFLRTHMYENYLTLFFRMMEIIKLVVFCFITILSLLLSGRRVKRMRDRNAISVCVF